MALHDSTLLMFILGLSGLSGVQASSDDYKCINKRNTILVFSTLFIMVFIVWAAIKIICLFYGD